MTLNPQHIGYTYTLYTQYVGFVKSGKSDNSCELIKKYMYIDRQITVQIDYVKSGHKCEMQNIMSE